MNITVLWESLMRREKKPEEIEITGDILRQLQRIQLEILIELDRICQKHSINYSIDGGTLLGAVRHKGFIPWDDDIDVIMSRIEYERFFEICKSELDENRFFMQERRTDPFYRVGYPRIRRRGTVYTRVGQENARHQTGVFIDLFVLDNMPELKTLQYIHRALSFCFRKILWSATGRRVSKSRPLRFLYAVVSLIPAKFAFWGFDTLARICNRKPTGLVRHYAMTYPNPQRNGFGTPARFLEGFTQLEFEGNMFMAVAGYDEYLTHLYGDYMTPTPPDKRAPHIHLSRFKPYHK